MNSPKIFVLALFLIGIAFVVGINLGATHSDDQKFQTPSWVTGLGTTITSPQSLKITDLSPASASCLQANRLVVPAGGICQFAIHEALFAVRVVRLQFIQPASVKVTLTQEGVLPVDQSLPVTGTPIPDALKVYPGKAHETLRIECLNAEQATACSLKLG